jgi:LysM repeat protein
MRRLIFILALVALLVGFSSIALAQETTQQAAGQTVHVVQAGENLYRISLRYNVTMQAIAAANGINNLNLIYVGQRLVIPTGGTAPQPGPTATPNPGNPGGTPSVYVVQRGDTLGRIAQRFATTAQAIASANGITNINLIYVGQRLNIPGGTGPAPGPVATATPRPGGPLPPISGGFELGGHVAGFNNPEQMRGAGMTYVKFQIRWERGQPASIAQDEIDRARAQNFRVLLGVVGRPDQLGANRQQYIAEFAAFLGGVAALNPDAIEVWNEPNLAAEWPAGQISGQAYAQMLQAAYQAIKNVNPNVLVISGAPAPTGAEGAFPGQVVNDDRFLRDMAAAGAANFMDCLGVHYNEGILPPTATSGDPRGNGSYYTRYYPSMVSVYSGIFPNKPLCFTELGYLTREGFGPLPPGFEWAADTSLTEQAEWLAGAVSLARNSGRVRLMIIWNVDFTSYGADPQAGFAIIRPDGQCPACATMGAVMD